ncbi:hypothetical protein JH146_0914 [Methanocaldococcus bathoardescens]|uniref:Uncharacterized protein n=1 Tax=Methanocaldococcus bathoardescens TaxID=1301915 RepID=A0A076LJL3_9EURY|nr:DUF6293 family protein [Methanocaldococcus bathoardescens]AIJ05759.1 hypothetical protein JH146_0914 [Methanocaldococcus bathoardescens]
MIVTRTIRKDSKEIKENLKRIKGAVHVGVLGYEVERITRVPIIGKAEKIYLITREEDKDTEIAKEFLKIIEKELKEHNIELCVKRTEPLNLENIVKMIKEIVKEEKENYTEKIYFNVSSGSVIGGIAGTLCAMAINDIKIIPYYVIPEVYFENLTEEEKEKLRKKYKEKYNYDGIMPRTFGVAGVEFIYPFDIKLPREELIIFLKYIKRAGDKGLSIKELIQLTKEEILDNINDEKEKEEIRKLINWRQSGKDKEKTTKQSDFVWINQNVVKKLLEWGLINEPIKRGRYRYITISEKGKKLLMYLE